MRQTPANLNALGQEFQIALSKADWTEALLLADKLIALLPENPSLAYNKGLVLKNLGRVPESLACFQATLDLAPDHHNAQFELAAALLESGQIEESARRFEDYLAAVPDDADASLNLGIALVQLGCAEAALPHLGYAQSRLGSAQALQWLATAKRDRGDLTAAEDLLAQLPADDANAQAARLKILTQGTKGRLALDTRQFRQH
ncbi:tetratricopeptide repeat protein [Denitrobaculum tricleocarpae]|uniref:Tetratricopeptide repeat protein n=1 Tax=Denitrobaculum tricleocarpae TaxID=2591009 RepID=A0A545TEP6_9PROT|nr:tetratricopeptide repeat protein [Denitrobaculum tricleocarpae]TQV75698.1 tetratricopeptide repeat protein [Denitrobaculum tricleocarpae]